MADAIVPPRPDPAVVRSRIESERRRLQKASAVLVGAVLAVEQGVDREIVGDAITAARELVDAAVLALDSVALASGSPQSTDCNR